MILIDSTIGPYRFRKVFSDDGKEYYGAIGMTWDFRNIGIIPHYNYLSYEYMFLSAKGKSTTFMLILL